MHHSHRLKKNEEFQEIFQKGKSAANRQFIVYSSGSFGHQRFRAGISVSKKLGNAVVRNRVKRLVKEAIASMEEQIPNGIDMVIIARPGTELLTYHSLRSSLQHALKRAKVLKSQANPNMNGENSKS
ncbi:MAG: ribonuclease P protein component [Clostridia bacterium]